MKCLSAFGVIIDTTKTSIIGQLDSSRTVKLYAIIGIKAIDLITGDIEERTYGNIFSIVERDFDIFSLEERNYGDISDIKIRDELIPYMYIGINESNGKYDLCGADGVKAYNDVGLLVYDVRTGKSQIIGSEIVYYRLFETLIIELNLSICKMRRCAFG